MQKYYLAIDIGASSGRHIVGWEENGSWQTDEVYRFPNSVTRSDGHLIWDIEGLLGHVKAGIDKALAKYEIESLAIDTWAVDYVLMKGDQEVMPCYSYRDSRTKPVISEVHNLMSFSELYQRTGIQFQPFNTIYQLYSDKLAGRLDDVTDFLMVPEYLLYKLSGVKAHEYTNATTGGMVNAKTGQYDPEILHALGLPLRLFGPDSEAAQNEKLNDNTEKSEEVKDSFLLQPGTVTGEYRGIKCVLCATHDTASAVEGIPMDDDQPYISSGTWSLLGVKSPEAITNKDSESANWSNEGGVGYVRYQKNIMGMWLVNRLRDCLCPGKAFGEIVSEAEASVFDETVDANAQEFLAPENMQEAFDRALTTKPRTIGDYFRCAYKSLALSYRDAVLELEHNTGKHYEKIYIVGGGAKNAFLNRLTEEASGKQVVALPIEATALGNLKIQRKAAH